MEKVIEKNSETEFPSGEMRKLKEHCKCKRTGNRTGNCF